MSFAADPSKLQAIDSAISELVNQVDPTGDQINQCEEKLASYVKRRATQLEGYESMEQLLSSISNTVALIRQTASDLRFWADQYEAAVALESAPGG